MREKRLHRFSRGAESPRTAYGQRRLAARANEYAPRQPEHSDHVWGISSTTGPPKGARSRTAETSVVRIYRIP